MIGLAGDVVARVAPPLLAILAAAMCLRSGRRELPDEPDAETTRANAGGKYDRLFFPGTWGVAATPLLPLAGAVVFGFLTRGGGGPESIVPHVGNATFGLGIASLATLLIARLMPGKLPLAYWGLLPFLGAFTFAFVLSSDPGLFLFQ